MGPRDITKGDTPILRDGAAAMATHSRPHANPQATPRACGGCWDENLLVAIDLSEPGRNSLRWVSLLEW
jgi:hypothetical protein